MNKRHITRTFVLLRWITRVVGTLVTLFMIYMLLSYIVGPEKSIPGAAMIVVLSFFATGVGLAWKWEGLGGLVIWAGSILLFVLYPRLIWPPNLYHAMPLIGILSLLCWLRLRDPQAGTPKDKQKH